MQSGWFAVALSKDIKPGEIKRLHYFGRELVLFRGDSGFCRWRMRSNCRPAMGLTARTSMACAVRPVSGDTFERLVRPEHDPKPLHLHHMGIDPDALYAGIVSHYVPSDRFGALKEKLCGVDDVDAAIKEPGTTMVDATNPPDLVLVLALA